MYCVPCLQVRKYLVLNQGAGKSRTKLGIDLLHSDQTAHRMKDSTVLVVLLLVTLGTATGGEYIVQSRARGC